MYVSDSLFSGKIDCLIYVATRTDVSTPAPEQKEMSIKGEKEEEPRTAFPIAYDASRTPMVAMTRPSRQHL